MRILPSHNTNEHEERSNSTEDMPKLSYVFVWPPILWQGKNTRL